MAEEDEGGSGSKGGNFFSRKLGPLPMWAWMGIFLGVALAYTSWTRNKKAASAESQAKTSGSLPTTQTASGSTPASLIPQFVNQVYNNETPPQAPTTTPTPTTPSSPVITRLNPAFNMVGWNDKAKQSPWTQVVALPGESWKDITARIYGFASNYASVNDADAKKRIDDVSAYLQKTNAPYTGELPGHYGPTPGSIVTYR